MSLLQSLLPELLQMIASHLDQASLAAMICTCTNIKECCISIQYKDVVLNDLACWHFSKSIKENPPLAAYVQSITFDHSEYFADHYIDSILPKLPRVRHLRVFAREQDFWDLGVDEGVHHLRVFAREQGFDRGVGEDENALGLGLWWLGPGPRVPSSVHLAASTIVNWLPDLRTCKSCQFLSFHICHPIPKWGYNPRQFSWTTRMVSYLSVSLCNEMIGGRSFIFMAVFSWHSMRLERADLRKKARSNSPALFQNGI